MDALQAKVVSNVQDLAQHNPRLVLLRNCVRSTLNLRLAAMHVRTHLVCEWLALETKSETNKTCQVESARCTHTADHRIVYDEHHACVDCNRSLTSPYDLCAHRASQATQGTRRVLVWPATHIRTGRGPALTDEKTQLAISVPSSNARGIPALGFYFDGSRVAFADNDALEVCHATCLNQAALLPYLKAFI